VRSATKSSGLKSIGYEINTHDAEVLTKLHRAPEKDDLKRWSPDEHVPVAARGPALFG